MFDEVQREMLQFGFRAGRAWYRRPMPWLVVDDDGVLVEPECRFVVDLTARDTRPA